MSNSWDDDDHERAIARALDADPDGEASGDVGGEVGGPPDDGLVDEYRDVLAQLPTASVTPRPELEDRVIEAALARRPAPVPALDRARARRMKAPGRLQLVALALVTVAAVVVIGLIVRNGSSTAAPGGRVSLATLQRSDVDALVRAAGSRTGSFGPNGDVVIARDGNGAAYGLAGTQPLSLGLVSSGGTTVLGPAPARGGVIAFVVDHPERVRAVELVRDGVLIARAELASR